MGHYHHMQCIFVFKDLPKDIVEMLDLQEKWLIHDRYWKQTEEETTRRRKECYDEVDKFAKKHKKNFKIRDFIKKHSNWDGFLLYESDSFEWIEQGTDYPWGWQGSGLHALHAKFDANYDNMGAFKDFVELVRPYVKSGSAWGWWESDMSAFEVFY